MKREMSYKDVGVDIDLADAFVERIKKKVCSTYGKQVVDGVGGFASIFDIGGGRLLAAGTDGVGTKLKIAQQLGIHDTIGIDLVAMCVNDILCTGANPLFFMDYLATGKLDLSTSESIITGIVDGCKLSNIALVGGETAEMPGMYLTGEYDLAGFAVGEIYRKHLIDGKKIQVGNTLIGISSSGLHSNGFSLVRKLINPNEVDILKECLIPTKIYVNLIKYLLSKYPNTILGMAHITGGGLRNIFRINPSFGYNITYTPPLSEVPSIFSILNERTNLSYDELYSTFNMGIGFVLVTNKEKEICNCLEEKDEKFWILGKVTKHPNRNLLTNLSNCE
mmetsp:Transcript_5182/g.2937  ORF Transcript_5182/g.2937 Transcript_5182/m.2937 type:complete len:335 (+) Transcript_5182:3938-4942(+)